MEEYTIVQVSAKIYWGFNIKISNNKLILMSETDIVEEIKESMRRFFKKYNLEELKEGVNELNLHIHGPFDIGKTIYVCDHGN